MTGARSGQNACRWRENPPDLIMVDLSMPKLDGWQVFEALKADSTGRHSCV